MNLIFDIGFNFGEFTNACNQKYPECKVVGVEANTLIVEKFNVDKFSNLTLLNYIVADADGKSATLHVDPNQLGISTVSTKFIEDSRFAKGSKNVAAAQTSWVMTLDVPTITLDRLVKLHGEPDVIKIDVEGYELEVLQGLTEKVGDICFEWHEEMLDVAIHCIEHLNDLGYTEFGSIGYYDNPQEVKKLTFSDRGDPYLVEPDRYLSKEDIIDELTRTSDVLRRINYGMLWAR
jgi:FkbM family methyltransferase